MSPAVSLRCKTLHLCGDMLLTVKVPFHEAPVCTSEQAMCCC